MTATAAIEILRAYQAGERIQLRWLDEPNRRRGWLDVGPNPCWNFVDAEYRIAESQKK